MRGKIEAKQMAIGMALALSIGLGSCGGGPTTLPTPTPTISPSQVPSGATLGPLRAQGNKWVDRTGRTVQLKGVSYIPPDSKVYGWPTWITDDILEKVRENGGNFVSVRLGPYSRDGEGIEWVAFESVGDFRRVNLDSWNPTFWSRVRSFTESAASRGIYVEFDLIDAWVLERPELSPWTAANNVNGYDRGGCEAISTGPDARQQQWLEKIGQELGGYDNVLFQISNEPGDGNCQGRLNPEWEIVIYHFMKRYGKPIGTNSHEPSVEAVVDYVSRHACSVPHVNVVKPVGVNEWNCSLTPEEFCTKQEGLLEGEWFLIWGDGMSREDWEEMLKCLKK